MPVIARSDYLAVFEAGGADALNQLLRSRISNPATLERELMRMEKSKRWKVQWSEDEGHIVDLIATKAD